MNDMELRFCEAVKLMQQDISRNAIAHGFYDDEQKRYFTCGNDGEFVQVDLSNYFKGNRIALQHSELSEGLEGIRKPQQDQHCPEFSSIEIELADTVIRVLDMAEFYKLRVIEAIIAKHTFNKSRPYKHGKAF